MLTMLHNSIGDAGRDGWYRLEKGILVVYWRRAMVRPTARLTPCVLWKNTPLAAFMAVAAAATTASAVEAPRFESHVLPVLERHCVVCHGADSPQAGLDLRSHEGLLKGGQSGPAIVARTSESSLLMAKIVSGAMPPGDDRLDSGEIELIRQWIDEQVDLSARVRAAVVTERDVLPIFQMRCVTCHGKRRQEAGLDLRTRESRLKGGKSGSALVPGKPDQSLLLKRVDAGEMPPPHLLMEFNVRPPNTAEVSLLRQWIAGGALATPEEPTTRTSSVSSDDRSFWAFQSPTRPAIPRAAEPSLVRNPVDSYLLTRLEAEGLSYAPQATPARLLRRTYLDLIGLPPTTAELAAFLEDDRPDAYERLVDRLLDSNRYGERWAQVWLDLAGYADSEGLIDEDRIRPNAWRYRDYVIRALNSDTPYDRFLTEQIAGDELYDHGNLDRITQQTIDHLAATGFLRMASDPTYSFANASLGEKLTVVSDEVEVLSSTVLALTVGCAKCHDHKYDPISQRDYYRLSAIFHTAYDPYDWVDPTERFLDIALEDERSRAETHNAPIEAKIKRLESTLGEKARSLRLKVIEVRVADFPEGLRRDLLMVFRTPAEERDEIQKYLAGKFGTVLEVSDADLSEAYPDYAEEAKKTGESIAELKKALRPKPQIRALYDMGGEPSAVYLLRRGDPQFVGERVFPQAPEVFDGVVEPMQIISPRPGETSGNRLALARWLSQPNHPLTSRVMVNRLWMHHFGRGLVPTPANFGTTGARPSHPNLLDWLAVEFVSSGWSLKHLHRLMMTSQAYRQSSRISEITLQKDPENKLLSRMPLRRMSAEVLYDSVLHATGRLDLKPYGPPAEVEVLDSGEAVAKGSREGWRRAVYTLRRRSTPVTLMDAYDLPQLSPNCTERSRSTVATQALQLMNGSTVRSHAQYLAGRLMDEHPDDRTRQIEELYLRLYSRPPTSEEPAAVERNLAALQEHWGTQLDERNDSPPRAFTARWRALGSVAHAMLNSNEFVYID